MNTFPEEGERVQFFVGVDPWSEETMPEYLRTAGLTAGGLVLMPAGWIGDEREVGERALGAGVPVCDCEGHIFVAAAWVADTYPEVAASVRQLGARVHALAALQRRKEEDNPDAP